MIREILAVILAFNIQSSFTTEFGSNIHILGSALGTVDISGAESIFFEIVHPEELSYTFKLKPAKDFGYSFNETHLGSKVRLVPSNPPWSCSPPRNAKALKGNIVLMERGECSFVQKALVAESIGARAVIIADNDPDSDDFYIEMMDDKTEREVHIPVAFLVGKNGRVIKNSLSRHKLEFALINIPVNMTYVSIEKMNQPPWMQL